MTRIDPNLLGRFNSPDPLADDTSDPRSLNRYSYVRNMPVMFADPSGACPATVENIPDGYVEGHGSFVLTRFFASDSESDADPDPDPDPQQGGNCDGGFDDGIGGWTLDGFDITSQTGGYGGFALGGGDTFGLLGIPAWSGPYLDPTGDRLLDYSIGPLLFLFGSDGGPSGGGGAGGSEQLPILPRPFNNLFMAPPGPTPPQDPCIVTQGLHTSQNAVDIRAQGGYGSSIPAPAQGTVTGFNIGGYYVQPPYNLTQPAPAGATDFVQFTTTTGYVVTYSHAEPVGQAFVQANWLYPQGATIATINQTGRTTGPHVHVTVRNPSGGYMDPRVFFPDCE